MIQQLLGNAGVIIGLVLSVCTFLGGLITIVWFAANYKNKIDGIISNQESIIAQFKPNGGSSLKDAIDRIEIETAFTNMEIKYFSPDFNVGTWRSDTSGKTIQVSMSLQKILKRSEEDFMGIGWLDFVHPDDIDRLLSSYKRSLETGLNFHEPYRIMVDGEYISVEAFTRKVFVGKKVVGYFGVITVV